MQSGKSQIRRKCSLIHKTSDYEQNLVGRLYKTFFQFNNETKPTLKKKKKPEEATQWLMTAKPLPATLTFHVGTSPGPLATGWERSRGGPKFLGIAPTWETWEKLLAPGFGVS